MVGSVGQACLSITKVASCSGLSSHACKDSAPEQSICGEKYGPPRFLEERDGKLGVGQKMDCRERKVAPGYNGDETADPFSQKGSARGRSDVAWRAVRWSAMCEENIDVRPIAANLAGFIFKNHNSETMPTSR